MYLSLKAVQWFTICGTSPPSGFAIGRSETKVVASHSNQWSNLTVETVVPERGSWRSPLRSHVGAHTIKRAASVCPHFLASISRCRLLTGLQNYASLEAFHLNYVQYVIYVIYVENCS